MWSFFTTSGFIFVICVIYAAGAQTVAVSEKDCASLVRHMPSANVAYEPGIDLNGRKVVPADVGGGVRIATPRTFEIPITVDLQKKLGIPVDPNSFQTQNFTVGVVNWEQGRAWFNGEPLQNEETARLAELCQEEMKRRR